MGVIEGRHRARLRSLANALVLAVAPFTAITVFGAVPAWAKGHSASTSVAMGNDISYPQCGKSFPSGQAFGIVGVNGGLANDANPCLGPTSGNVATSELYWASNSSGITKQPKAQLYVNTADPGNGVDDWPASSNTSDPWTCVPTISGGTTGANSLGCAWQYGYNMAETDVGRLAAAATSLGISGAISSYDWWLDVETGNSWQSGTYGMAMNLADLQGMAYVFNGGISAPPTSTSLTNVGVYSTGYQWGQIVGGSVTESALGNLDLANVWLPGARSQSGAVSNCATAGFTGGRVTITQWFSHPIDSDYSCIG